MKPPSIPFIFFNSLYCQLGAIGTEEVNRDTGLQVFSDHVDTGRNKGVIVRTMEFIDSSHASQWSKNRGSFKEERYVEEEEEKEKEREKEKEEEEEHKTVHNS